MDLNYAAHEAFSGPHRVTRSFVSLKCCGRPVTVVQNADGGKARCSVCEAEMVDTRGGGDEWTVVRTHKGFDQRLYDALTDAGLTWCGQLDCNAVRASFTRHGLSVDAKGGA